MFKLSLIQHEWQQKRRLAAKENPWEFSQKIQCEIITRVQVGVSGRGEVKRNVRVLFGGLLGFESTLLVLNDKQRKASIDMLILVERAS